MKKKIIIQMAVVALLVEIPLLILDVNLPIVLICTFTVVYLTYFISWQIIYKRINNIIDRDCDPEKYIIENENLLKLSKKKSFTNIIYLNIATGYIDSGNYEKAYEYFNKFDFSAKNKESHILVYHINYIAYLINSKQFIEAEKHYNDHVKNNIDKNKSPIIKSVAENNKYLLYYFLNKSLDTAEEYKLKTKPYYDFVIKRDFKRARLKYIYTLACIERDSGEKEEALKKFNKVIDEGYKLNIVNLSKTAIDEILNGS